MTLDDFDGDNDIDIIVGNQISNSISFVENDGTGNFHSDTSFTLSNYFPI